MLDNNMFDLLITIAILWETIWKGMGLWKAAHKDRKVWFAAILVINMVGLIPITYLLLEHYGLVDKINQKIEMLSSVKKQRPRKRKN